MASQVTQTNAAKRLLYAAIRNKTITLEREDPVGEPIFIYKRPPDIPRPAVLRYAIKGRLRRWAYKPAQWIFPELRAANEVASGPAEPAE